MGDDWKEKVEAVESRGDLAAFVGDLAKDLAGNAARWENVDLRAYLKAIAAWLNDMDGYYENVSSKPAPGTPSWRTFAEILSAAAIYE
jgi:hypothetical protein